MQFDSFEDAQDRLKLWIKYYNYRRPHQGINGLCPADRFFEVQSEIKKVLSSGIEENVLEMSLRGRPQKPFYMVGRWGDQSVVLHAEKGRVKMLVDGEEKEKNISYDIEEVEDEQHKEQCREGESGEDAAEEPEGIRGAGEVSGGAVDMVGEAQTGAGVQGTGDKLDDTEPVAEEGACRNVEGDGAAQEHGAGSGSGIGTETGEASDEREPEGSAGEQAGEASGGDPGRDEKEISEDRQPDRGVIYLRKDQVPLVLEVLREFERKRSENGVQERGREGQSGPVEGRVDHESALETDDGIGGGETAGGEPQDLLQVGEAGCGGDAFSLGGQGLRATLLPGGWGEGEYQEAGEEDAEIASAGRAEALDPYVYGR